MNYLLALVILLTTFGTGFAGVVKLAWEYDSIGHTGFRLYYGQSSHVSVEAPAAPRSGDASPYETVLVIDDPSARSYEIALPDGTYYFRLTTIGPEADSVFTHDEPMAKVGVDVPKNFKVEWMLLTPKEGK